MRFPRFMPSVAWCSLLTTTVFFSGCDEKKEETSSGCLATDETPTAAALNGDETAASETGVDEAGCPKQKGAVDSGKQPGGSGGSGGSDDTVDLDTDTDTTTTPEIPGTFSISGSSGVAATTVPALTWTASAGVTTYSVQVATAANCANPVASATGLTTLGFTPSSVTMDGTYYVCVTAHNATGTRPASNSSTFTFIVDTTGPAALLSFGAVTPRDLGALDIQWQAAASHGDYAKMVIRSLAGGTAPADCTAGSALATYTSFSNTPISYYIYMTPGTTMSFRACVYDALDNVTTSGAMTAANVTSSTDRKIFVSSAKFTGDLKANYNGQTFANGFDGADYRCTYLANSAGHYGRFTAILGGKNSRDPWAWTRVGGAVYDVNGVKVADDKANLYSNSQVLDAAVSRTEQGAIVSSDLKAWTSFIEGDNDGPMGTQDDNCQDWSNANFPQYGYYGVPTATNGTWVNSTGQFCSSEARLYCVQQESKPNAMTAFSAVAGGSPGSGVVTVDFPSNTFNYHQLKVYRMKGKVPHNPNCDATATGATLIRTYGSGGMAIADGTINDTTGSEGFFSYLGCLMASDGTIISQYQTSGFQTGTDFQSMFITSSWFSGNLGGLAGADQQCQDHADAVPLAGTWKAVLSASGMGNSAAERIAITKNMYDVAGNFIAADDTDLWDSKLGSRGIRSSEFGSESTGFKYWTGSTAAGATDSDNCQDWSFDTNSSSSGETGEAGRTDLYWVTFSGSGCNGFSPILCVNGQ